MLRRTTVALVVLTALAAALARAQTTAPARTRPPASAPAVAAVPWDTEGWVLEPARVTLADLRKKYPAFEHARYDQAGQFHVTLPFLYEDPDKIGDPNEALALAFLVSHSLDWTQGNYCTRHAYFTFKRSKVTAMRLTLEHEPPTIARFVQKWSGTHAVGGTLRRTQAGYAGRLVIYHADGTVVHEKAFDKPVPFFTFLGDLCAEAMTFFGDPPNDAMRAHLSKERAKPESLVKLGRAAFADERSPAEFQIYQELAHDEPLLAEVRAYWANQKQWEDGNRDWYMRQLGFAIEAHLTANGLDDFNSAECSDRELVAKLPQWMDQAEALVGPDNVLLLTARLRDAERRKVSDPALLRRGLEAARRFPNSRWLLDAVAERQREGRGSPIDLEMAASIWLASAEDRYTPGVEQHLYARELAQTLWRLGRPAEAAAVVLAHGDDQTPGAYRVLAGALADLGKVDEAAALLRKLVAARGDAFVIAPVHDVALAAVLRGRRDVVDDLRHRYAKAIADDGSTFLFETMSGVLADEPPTVETLLELPNRTPKKRDRHGRLVRVMGALRREIMPFAHGVRDHVARYPNDRLAWVLYDTAQRFDPSSSGDAFYQTMNWLHAADDAWAGQIVVEWQRRVAKPYLHPVTNVRHFLREFPPVPALVPVEDARLTEAAKQIDGLEQPASVVVRLVEAGDFATARELAQRLLHYASYAGAYEVKVAAVQIANRVERAAAAAPAR